MSELLPLNPDELLTTTRTVRKRLDFDRPVSVDVIKEIIQIAIQAPSGSNQQSWHWIILTDPERKKFVADYYRQAFSEYRKTQKADTSRGEEYAQTMSKVASSAEYLAENLEKAPALVIAAIDSGSPDLSKSFQVSLWGSLFPAAWSFALAARARGIGTAWTTLHIVHEKEIAKFLGIPETVHQGVLFPVAYTKGTDFKPGKRLDLDPIVHVNQW